MAERKKRENDTALLLPGASFFVGTFYLYRSGRRGSAYRYGYVLPDDKHVKERILVSRERSKGAKQGQKVVVRLTDRGGILRRHDGEKGFRARHRSPEGIVREILGFPEEPGVELLSVIRSYGLRERFPKEVLEEAELAAEKGPLESGVRRDLRDLMTVTIDGEDSRDFDDAVSLTSDREGWHLGVHIADVSHYVKEGTALDREALTRGTSVYFPGTVLPMLPEVLSNGVCSLNPMEDRLCLSCLMTIDHNGRVLSSEICESVIRSKHRLTYDQVNELLRDEAAGYRNEYADAVPMLVFMGELAAVLKRRREQQGAVEFDLTESEIRLDEAGEVKDVVPRGRNAATELIEEFMLLANETVAETFCFQEIPFIYRSHEKPEAEKMQEFSAFVSRLGYHLHLGNQDIHPKELQKLLKQAKGRPEEALIAQLTLRSMAQAKYTVDARGHFGLACRYYCHFTSPIRRYPDLQIHRIIKESLKGELTPERTGHYALLLPGVAEESSRMERQAEGAEREMEKLYKVRYMTGHIGECYEGIVSGVTDWGIYVELPNTVEGMIPLRDLADDYYEYDPEYLLVRGHSTGKTFRLGQPLSVVVTRADVQAREIDFAPADEDHLLLSGEKPCEEP